MTDPKKPERHLPERPTRERILEDIQKRDDRPTRSDDSDRVPTPQPIDRDKSRPLNEGD